MSIKYLHVSDAHFTDSENFRNKKTIKALFNYFDKEIYQFDFIFFTGDLSKDGKQYVEAEKFLNELINKTMMLKYPSIEEAKKHFFIVPGNHDVNRSSINSARITSAKEADNFKTWDKTASLRQFDDYFNFYNTFFYGIKTYNSSTLQYSEIVEIEKK